MTEPTLGALIADLDHAAETARNIAAALRRLQAVEALQVLGPWQRGPRLSLAIAQAIYESLYLPRHGPEGRVLERGGFSWSEVEGLWMEASRERRQVCQAAIDHALGREEKP